MRQGVEMNDETQEANQTVESHWEPDLAPVKRPRWVPVLGGINIALAAFGLVCGGLGIRFGRPLARLGVRALLPPSMRGPLAELWFTDGKPLPTNTRTPRTLYPETRKASES